MMLRRKPVVLIVRDGWGCNPHLEHDAFNAVKIADTPNCDALLRNYPWAMIHTSGEPVGLPEGTMGNSEVGHQNLGAGRIVAQESVRITKAIRSGDFFDNHVLIDAIEAAKGIGGHVHLLGIASDVGVHGMITHLFACLKLCKQRGQDNVAIHCLTDGRDSGPFTGKGYIEQIEDRCRELGVGRIASICGRYYAMDRDNRWDRVEQAYACLTGINARQAKQSWAPIATQVVQRYYDQPTNDSQRGDEFILPTMIGNSLGDCLSHRIHDGDTIIFVNYRGDRPRELVKAFVLSDQSWNEVAASPDTSNCGFDRKNRLDTHFVTMTAYEKDLPVHVAFPKPPMMTGLAGQYLSDQGLTQFRCAETEKFPHVTVFFNDYRKDPYPGESRQMVQSPRVATYDLKPQMSALKVTELVVEQINSRKGPDFILANYANGDMVGHTGNLNAATKAIETVDTCVGSIVEATAVRGGALIVTADHGNAEQMFDPQTNSPHTAHTIYDVECIIVDPDSPHGKGTKLREGGQLADIFPTVLALIGLEKPREMTGRSLFQL